MIRCNISGQHNGQFPSIMGKSCTIQFLMLQRVYLRLGLRAGKPLWPSAVGTWEVMTMLVAACCLYQVGLLAKLVNRSRAPTCNYQLCQLQTIASHAQSSSHKSTIIYLTRVPHHHLPDQRCLPPCDPHPKASPVTPRHALRRPGAGDGAEGPPAPGRDLGTAWRGRSLAAHQGPGGGRAAAPWQGSARGWRQGHGRKGGAITAVTMVG